MDRVGQWSCMCCGEGLWDMNITILHVFSRGIKNRDC